MLSLFQDFNFTITGKEPFQFWILLYCKHSWNFTSFPSKLLGLLKPELKQNGREMDILFFIQHFGWHFRKCWLKLEWKCTSPYDQISQALRVLIGYKPLKLPVFLLHSAHIRRKPQKEETNTFGLKLDGAKQLVDYKCLQNSVCTVPEPDRKGTKPRRVDSAV